MIHRKLVFVCALSLLLPGYAAFGQKRITDMQGREVRIGPAAAPVQPATPNAMSFTPHAATTVTVNAGPDIDAANNDYRRIQNALNAAAPGDTIILNGTFDFTRPFAAAAWALGNDNTTGTADDYEVLAPRGVNNVTLTANSLGSATIQGPGDLAAVNLESFLVFDQSVPPGGGNQGWTVSNLRILDFDLSIGMFAGVPSDFSNDYNNTTITNNFIRMPRDLNATVAPADMNQNIGIHFSFGANQTISNNTFNIPGDGVSNGANTSSDVVMQSNTGGGGAMYNGLRITGNVIHILKAQSADPEYILFIWENGYAHSSNITIADNNFINDAAGNRPSLNIQRGFCVTSHSGATTTVTYSGNKIGGANIGFLWITGSDFAGHLPVRLIGNTITSCDTGVLVQSNGRAHLETDVITGSGAGGGVHVAAGQLAPFGANPNGMDHTVVSGGSGDGVRFDVAATTLPAIIIVDNDLSKNTGFALHNLTANPVTAATNYWGSNLASNVAAKVSGPSKFDPWLASGTDVNTSIGFQPFVYATTTTAGNLTTLAGTAVADTGSMLATSPVTMMMGGDTGSVPVAELSSVAVQLGNSDDVFTLGQTGIPTTVDGGAGNDTLIGTNVAQTWNITGANSGNVPGATSSFLNIESLRGGTAADSFLFGAAGSLAQSLDGNLGVDTLDNTAIPGHTVTPTGPGTLDGFMGTATGVGSTFDNINIIGIGGPAGFGVLMNGPDTVFNPRTTISYTIIVTNNGSNPANNARLTDEVPTGATFSSLFAPGDWSCTTPVVSGTGTITCSKGSMPVGSAVFTLKLTVYLTGTVSNTASVSSTDVTPGNKSSTVNTKVKQMRP